MHRPRRSQTEQVFHGQAYSPDTQEPYAAYAGIQPSPTDASATSASRDPARRPVSDPQHQDLVHGLGALQMSEDDRVGPLPGNSYPVMGRSRSTASGRSSGGMMGGAGPPAAASVYSLDSGMGAYGQYPGVGIGNASPDPPYTTRRTSAQSTRSNMVGIVPGETPAYDALVSRDHGFPHPPPPVPGPQYMDYNPYMAAANDYLGPAPGPSTNPSPAGSSSHLLRTASSASSLVSLKRTNTTNIGSRNARRQGHAGAIDVTKPPYTREFVDDYRARMKADPDPEAQFAFAKYLIEAARIIGDDMTRAGDSRGGKKYRDALLAESLKHIKRLATSGPEPYAEAQFFLANMYGTGQLGLAVDYEKAYQLYMQASKQNHPAATYRTAVCNELGAGTRKEATRAVLFYRKAASLRDSAAMYKLAMILLHGLLEQPRNAREGITWLRRAAQQADAENPHALHELAMLHESPALLGRASQLIPKDHNLAREFYTQAAQLGYPPSQFKLGTAYEYGHLGCPRDPKRSIAWLSRAAEKADPEAELALSGWFLTGAEGVLKQDDAEAYLWAKKSAMKGLAKAEFAVGYYTEVGIGVKQDIELAKRWYMRAAAQQHPQAMQRLTDMKKNAIKANGARPTRQEAADGCIIA
ncbi:hypothetical protein NliqN6_0108 [Naganishia liquefaciens]|uniref:Sel1 repeat family protein n=1 Tax=Naganishia liquefaciens TaxID=104408 RepID=A0A8H3TN14_9TREE|nr:hypothetical protein NliqN6_0108 [Naganishia liquefaciens]